MKYLGYDDSIASSNDDFREKYIRAEISPENGDLSQTWMCLKRKEGACIFLDPVGKCGIYDVRPVQCSTYPFWPSLVESSEDWLEESVLPDEVAIDDRSLDRHWSPELGGCEGIGAGKSNNDSFDVVAREEIIAKKKAAKKHWKRFPVQEIKESTWYL